jgi:hypothetical protein
MHGTDIYISQNSNLYLYINLTLGAFCVFLYASLIIGPNTSKLGMQTLLDLPLGVRLCLIKKLTFR